MKLINRYNQYLFPLLILLFIASTVSTYFFVRQVLQNELDGILQRSKKRVEAYVAKNNELPEINSFSEQKITFTKLNGPLTDSGISSTTQFIPEQNKEHISRKVVFRVKANTGDYKAIISAPLEGTHHLTWLIGKIAFVTILCIFLFIILVNRQLLSKIWRPFYDSLEAIKSFKVQAPGMLALGSSSIEEFNLMNSHFKMAAENAARDFKNLKAFSENASHEIQTPLAIIHSKLDLLVQQENLTEKQSELLQSMYFSVNKLSKIQQSLLLLTKIDNGQFMENSELSLDKTLRNKLEQFQDIWNSRRIEFQAEIEASRIIFNRDLLEILLNNLFSNATRHNIEGGFVRIISHNGTLEISNSGVDKPIDPEQIFRRFYKGHPNAESSGLGLSIIKEICEVSGVTISYFFQNNLHSFALTWNKIH
jgi:signal transduction histidine kinase